MDTDEILRVPAPLGDRVIVRQHDPETVTSFGLVLPQDAQEKPYQGTVLAVGPGQISSHTGNHLPMQTQVGDTVLYSRFGGTEISIGGEDLLVLRETDVLAIVTNND